MSKDDRWLIWSIEHDAWWGSRSAGYVRWIENAGLYTYDEALEIVRGANYSMTTPTDGKRFSERYNKPNEAMVLVTPEIAAKMGI